MFCENCCKIPVGTRVMSAEYKTVYLRRDRDVNRYK